LLWTEMYSSSPFLGGYFPGPPVYVWNWMVLNPLCAMFFRVCVCVW
jgi:hypothetical protein